MCVSECVYIETFLNQQSSLSKGDIYSSTDHKIFIVVT
jgi:hypothetical protein